jgi:DNA-binding CsgD family transcriptional regulator
MQPVNEFDMSECQLKEKLEFYESILSKLPAIIFINEIRHGQDKSAAKNIWSNKWALNFIGYEQEEINEMGYDFVKQVSHPEDIELPRQSLELSGNNQDMVSYSLNRQKPKNQLDYQWLYSRTITLETFPDGSPQKSLNIAFEFHNEMQSENQLVSLLKEINCLKHKLKLKSLTQRENQIIKLVKQGLTDKEIGSKLSISIATAKTHRNKILKKLGLKNSAALAAFAAECGLF